MLSGIPSNGHLASFDDCCAFIHRQLGVKPFERHAIPQRYEVVLSGHRVIFNKVVLFLCMYRILLIRDKM